ncbi:MAG: chromosome segregation protein SMC [bacterium]
MHLTSLTLKGFKSFASATTLRFEPGITAVVGPNGSGKSNVVDAIAWVLGEQGAKALRGGKMEDVIFAGTAGRAPLGRAEVTLTIDNRDGALPVDYAEIALTRRMFRDGASEYEINGQSARLLDIQELLSDSGIGREMHVIVGQGQLDSVLQARPEDRRGFIEEAAGVLKHRKRKEKALRKLEAMQANLTRLSDLTAELRRQLKPLGRQAEIARRAAGVQAELRDARLRLLADDLLTLRTQLAREVADEEAIRDERTRSEAELAAVRGREAELDAALADAAPALAGAQDTWYRLTALEERLRGTARLAAERHRHLAVPMHEARAGRDPEAMDAEAAEARAEESRLRSVLQQAETTAEAAVHAAQRADAELAAAESAVAAALRARADRREGLATLSGQVDTARERAAAAAAETARLDAAAARAEVRAAHAKDELSGLEAEVGNLDAGELGLDERHEIAAVAATEIRQRREDLERERQGAERDHSTWSARRDALALGLTRRDGAGALLEAGARLPGVLGSVAALLTVEPGQEAALAAALGALADAVAVSSPHDAAAALELLKADDAGRAGLLVGGGSGSRSPGRSSGSAGHPGVPPITLPDVARWAIDLVRAPAEIQAALDEALDAVAVVSDLPAAVKLVERHPEVRAVTLAGDVLGRGFAAGGSASAPSTLEIQAAADEADARATEAAERTRAADAALVEVRADEAAAVQAEQAALAELHESDARLAAITEALAELGQRVRSAAAEADRLRSASADSEAAAVRHRAALADLEERLRHASSTEGFDDGEAGVDGREAARMAAAEARRAEIEARLTVRTAEERVRALGGRADALEKAAREERAARRRDAQRRAERAHGARVAAAVGAAAEATLVRLADSRRRAEQVRDTVQARRTSQEAEAVTVRVSVRSLAARVEQLTDAVHRDEVLRTEQRLRIEALQQRAAEEFGVDPDSLLAEYGPDQLVPPSAQETAEYEQARERGEDVVAPPPGPFRRPTQEKRAARAERDLALLGRVNPLALEEFSALEERHQFLATQLEDIKTTRRDLMTVVREVDERILAVFSAAYADVAREFEVVFATLFPGGEGRLVLTDPDDLLTTGIDVEARPPGKKVKRLSLLSGGERSLTAVALLVAIFRARPSPFYIMDEVEAALDDINLGRLLALISELRSSSQLVVITHQKRTMEIADALYGVTMRGDGISQVISQRLRTPAEEVDGLEEVEGWQIEVRQAEVRQAEVRMAAVRVAAAG